MITPDGTRWHARLRTLGAILLACCVCADARAQLELPVVRANSPKVVVREDGREIQDGWQITPAIPLDIYVPRRRDTPVTVTFITDIETRSFEVKPGEKVDFAFLLNGRDSCRTQIWMKERPAQRLPGTPPGPVTIPFKTLGGKPHVQGRINGSATLWLLFDSGAATTVIYPSAIDKGVSPRFDGTVLNAGTGGTVERQTASDNRIEIAGYFWEHESAIFVEKNHDAGDGIIGVNIFEGKLVEIDYEREVMVIHDALPEHAGSYASLPLSFEGTLLTVPGAFGAGTETLELPMVINTGGTGALMGNSQLAEVLAGRKEFTVVGSSQASGVGPKKIAMDVVLVPELQIAGHTFRNVPMNMPSRAAQADVPSVNSAGARGMLCLDILSKFNTILDLKDNRVYFKANSKIDEPIKVRTGGPSAGVLAALVAAALGILWLGALLLRRLLRRGK